MKTDINSLTVAQLKDIAQCAADVIKSGLTPAPNLEGEMAEAVFSAGLVSDTEYDDYCSM